MRTRSFAAAMVAAALLAGCEAGPGGDQPATDSGGTMLPDGGAPSATDLLPQQGEKLTEAQCLGQLQLAPASCEVENAGRLEPPCFFPTQWVEGTGCVAECYAAGGTRRSGLRFLAELALGEKTFTGISASASLLRFTCKR